MKKLLSLVALVTVFGFSANAQEEGGFKPFKVDLSAGYAIPGGSGSKGGILFVVEPKYAIMPNLSLGLRLEAAVVARVAGNATTGTDEAEVKASASYLATGDYYFTDNYSFRPFAGAGVGLYSVAAATATATGSGDAAGSGNKFGGMIRAGVEAGHFRFGAEYNIVPASTYDNTGTGGGKVEVKNGYIGIKLGVVLGGGPR